MLFDCPWVLSLNNLKLYKISSIKNIVIQEKLIILLTFNPGLALTGFRRPRPRRLIEFLTLENSQKKIRTLIGLKACFYTTR